MKTIICWRCLYQQEYLGFKYFLSNKGKCLNCRCDYLDKKFGPSYTAKMWAKANKGKYLAAPKTKWERLGLEK